MKWEPKIWIVLLTALAIFSCQKKADEKTAETETQVEEKPKICNYSYTPHGTKVTWTAYKFTQKTGVSGTFDTLDVSGTRLSEEPLEVVRSLSFTIMAGSVNSGNPDRDAKLAKDFFGKMKGGSLITGAVKSIGPDKAIVLVRMNDVEMELEMTLKQEGDSVLVLEGVLDTPAWKLQKPMRSLATACQLLHTGEDGVSKLWPDILISIRSKVEKNCQ